MPDYMSGFTDEERERLFHFLVLFARWECALKRSQFVRKGSYGQAEADWNAFADTVTGSLAAVNAPAFILARTYLLDNPLHCLTRKVLETGSLPQLRKVLETGGEATVSLSAGTEGDADGADDE